VAEQLTLNQRVQGSCPCAPTNVINHLAGTMHRPGKGRVRDVSAFTLSARRGFGERAPNYESGGQEFESLRARQLYQKVMMVLAFDADLFLELGYTIGYTATLMRAVRAVAL